MKKTNLEDIKYLYEGISLEQHDFLNEESEYFDEEIVELIEEITYSIAFGMLHEGYSANGVLNFLSKSSDEDIIEYYLNPPVISEDLVSQEHIDEQAEIIFEKLGLLRNLGQIFAKRAPALKSAGPLTQKAATRLAMQGKPTLATKAKVGLQRLIGPKGRKAIDSVKNAAGAAMKNLPKIAKGALLVGTGVGAGYLGAKLGGSGGEEGSADGAKTSPEDKAKWNASAAAGGQAAFKAGGGAAKMKQNPEMSAADVQKIGMQNLRKLAAGGAAPDAAAPAAPAAPSGGGSGSGGGSSSGSRVTPAKPSKSQTPAKPTDGAERRAATSAELAAAQKARKDALEAGKSKEEAEKAAVKAGVERGSKLMGGPEGPGQIDTKSVEADIKAEQERQKKRQEQKASQSQTTTTKESYDAYDIILEYLMNTEQAETLDEAHYIMLEMDEIAVGNILEEYENHILSMEIQEWVNSRVDEGYDFSEYSWEDITEYYVNEVK